MSAPTYLKLPLHWKPPEPTPKHFMPIENIALGIILSAAAGLPITAAVTLGDPAPDSFTLVGAALSAFCVVAYMRMKQPTVGVWPLIFNVVATGSVGWMAPEVLAYYVLQLDGVSNKLWTGLAFACGLAGGALVTAILVLMNRRLPLAVDKLGDKLHLPKQDDSSAPEGGDVRPSRWSDIKWSRRSVNPKGVE